MTAEEKWDKLRAHVAASRRHLYPDDAYDEGFRAALIEIGSLMKRMDQEGQ